MSGRPGRHRYTGRLRGLSSGTSSRAGRRPAGKDMLLSARTAVVVLNRNGGDLLNACFKAVLTQGANGGCDFVLLDNGSTDGGPDLVERAFPEVKVMRLDANLGYAGAYNRALKTLSHEYLVAVNNDTEPRAGWLAALVAAADADPGVAAVTSKLLFARRPGILQSAGSLLLSDGAGADRGSGEPDEGQFDRREEVFAFNGGSALLRRSAVEEVGWFDERFFAYYEDTDLSWRLRLRGWRILYEPASVIDHVHSATNREGSDFFTFHVDRNRLLMLIKNGSPRFVVSALRSVAARTVSGDRTGATSAGGRSSRHYARVVGSLVANLPAAILARLRIRRGMTVGDEEIERWVVPRERWDAHSV